MGRIYNRKEEYDKREMLRHNMTEAKVLLWLKLKGKNINGLKFKRQYSVGKYVLDFYCPKLKLAIEIDDATHTTDEQIEYNTQRQKEIESVGIRYLRFSNRDIYNNLAKVLEKVREKTKELYDS